MDLSNCSLSAPCAGFQAASTAAVIDLTENPLQESIPNTTFRGFTRLQSISLPLPLECPGGSMAWDTVTMQAAGQAGAGSPRLSDTAAGGPQPSPTSNPDSCLALPACLCPESSLCAPDGPGLFQCLCAGSSHGYKCLREGAFPMLLFYGTLGAVTTSLALLAWGTQRRKAKSS
uniref:EGF-like domain-containing protein n=1 Tax=Pelodiscus sinensis TaxID=13735 RepID=K7GFS2_PELSI